MLAFLNTPTFPVFSPPFYPSVLLYLSVILNLLSCFYLLCTNLPRTDTCNKPHTLRDAVTGRHRKPLAAASSSRLLETEPKLFVFETSYYAFYMQ